MQPIRLPLPPQWPSSLCKHFKVLPSAAGNKANESAVNWLRRSRHGEVEGAWGGWWWWWCMEWFSSHGGPQTASPAWRGHRPVCDGTLLGGVNRWSRAEEGREGWTPGPIHRMDICADGKTGWMAMFTKGESTLWPLFWCNVPAERSNLSAGARKWSRQNAQTHKRLEKIVGRGRKIVWNRNSWPDERLAERRDVLFVVIYFQA